MEGRGGGYGAEEVGGVGVNRAGDRGGVGGGAERGRGEIGASKRERVGGRDQEGSE